MTFANAPFHADWMMLTGIPSLGVMMRVPPSGPSTLAMKHSTKHVVEMLVGCGHVEKHVLLCAMTASRTRSSRQGAAMVRTFCLSCQ